MMKHHLAHAAVLAACMLAAAAGGLPAQIPLREPPQEAFPGALVIPQWSRDLEKQQQAFEDVIVRDASPLPPAPLPESRGADRAAQAQVSPASQATATAPPTARDEGMEAMLRVLANVRPGTACPGRRCGRRWCAM